MSIPTAVLIATIALTLLGVVIALIAQLRAAGPRVVAAALGFTLLPFGLWLTGVMDMLGNGIKSLVNWYDRTTIGVGVVAGLILLVVGVLLLLSSRVIKPRSSEHRKAELAKRSARPTAPQGSSAALPAGSAPAASAPVAKAAPASDEDDEIEALLRKRGIE